MLLAILCLSLVPSQNPDEVAERTAQLDEALELARREEGRRAGRVLRRALDAPLPPSVVAPRLAEIYRAARACEIAEGLDEVDLESVFTADRVRLDRERGAIELEPLVSDSPFGGKRAVDYSRMLFTDALEMEVVGKVEPDRMLGGAPEIEVCTKGDSRIVIALGAQSRRDEEWLWRKGILVSRMEGEKQVEALLEIEESPLEADRRYHLRLRIEEGRLDLLSGWSEVFSLPLEVEPPMGGFRVSIWGLRSVDVEGVLDPEWLEHRLERWTASRRSPLLRQYDPAEVLPGWIVELGGDGPGSTLARVEVQAEDLVLADAVADAWEAGEIEQARRTLSQARSSPPFEFLRALVASEVDEPEQAATHLARAREGGMTGVEIDVLAARIRARGGGVRAAITELTRLSETASLPTPTAEAVRWLFRAGAHPRAVTLLSEDLSSGTWTPHFEELVEQVERAQVSRSEVGELFGALFSGEEATRSRISSGSFFAVVENERESRAQSFLDALQQAFDALRALRPVPDVLDRPMPLEEVVGAVPGFVGLRGRGTRIGVFERKYELARYASDAGFEPDETGWRPDLQQLLVVTRLDEVEDGLDDDVLGAVVDLYLSRSWIEHAPEELRATLIEVARGEDPPEGLRAELDERALVPLED